MISKKQIRFFLLSVFAISFAVYLFAGLIRRSGGLTAIQGVLGNALNHPAYLALGLGLIFLSLACGVCRWYLLMRYLRLPVRFWSAVRLYAAGVFFNLFGPGATGGDVVKAAWLARYTPGYRAEVVASIAAERLIGFMGLVFFITFVSVVRYGFFASHPALLALRGMIYGFCLFFVLLLILMVFLDAKTLERRLANGRTGSMVVRLLLRGWETMHLCMSHKKATGYAFSLSILNHFCDVCCYFAFAHALGLPVLFQDVLVVSPLANSTAALPLTPGGSGVRETALQMLLRSIGLPDEASASLGLLMFSGLLFWSLASGIYLLCCAAIRRRGESREAEEPEKA